MDDDIRALLEGISASQAGHLPVVAAFLRRIGLAGAVDATVHSQMAVDIGTFVSLMARWHRPEQLLGNGHLRHLEDA